MAVQTITITDFSGRLTRRREGALTSGFAKFETSWGYDPFSEPGQLTWFEQPTSILSTPQSSLLMGMRVIPSGQTQYAYGVDNVGTFYRIEVSNAGNPNIDAGSILGNVSSNSASYNYGASLEYYRSSIFVGGDNGVHYIQPDGTGDTSLGTTGNYKSNSFRPLKTFAGKLLFGNGNTIGVIDSTGTVTSSVIGTGQGNIYSQFNPPLPPEFFVTDIDTSINNDYAMVTASGTNTENLLSLTGDRIAGMGNSGLVAKWNGVDLTATAGTNIPSYAVTALQVYLGNNFFFENDSFGSSVSDGNKKKITLPNNKSPFANATTTNGNFLSWFTPEVIGNSSIVGSLYYMGALDDENQPGLYRLLRYSPTLTNGFVYQCPVNALTSNKYSGINTSRSSVQALGYGKHYLSVYEVNETTTAARLLKFFVTPTGTGAPVAGVYETQNQTFPKRMAIKGVRVYTKPTVAGNGFQLQLIGADGSPLSGGTFSYTFAAGDDETKLQGAMERINFEPDVATFYSIGARVTNTGTTNMTFKKIELDVTPSGQ